MILLTDIKTCFDQIKAGLEAIKAKTGALWSFDDVYRHCTNGEWMLFTEPGVDGFLMLMVYECKYTGERRMEVACAYYKGEADPTKVYLPFILMMAREMEIIAVEVKSPRKGWERKGFKPVEILYRMEVPNE